MDVKMNGNRRTLLIVDDSEVDRAILKNILDQEYEVIEAANGYIALEYLNNPSFHLDGLLLDITMPAINGFGVLERIDKTRLSQIQVLLISAETSKENIVKSFKFGIKNLIKKPYDAKLILNKLKTLFAESALPHANNTASPVTVITPAEMTAISNYVEKLRRVYLTYLKSVNLDDSLYKKVSEIVHIMLANYYAAKTPRDLSPEAIEVITQASFFYDIGRIVVRTEDKSKTYNIGELDDIPETHTIAGADLIGINSTKSVSYFVKVAADICMHHHERYDGRGFPHRLKSSINNLYTQIVAIAISFSSNFFKVDPPGIREYSIALSAILKDKEAFRPDVIEILENSKDDIINYYSDK